MKKFNLRTMFLSKLVVCVCMFLCDVHMYPWCLCMSVYVVVSGYIQYLISCLTLHLFWDWMFTVYFCMYLATRSISFVGNSPISILCLAIRMMRLDIYFQAKILQEIWALKWSFLCLCKKKNILPIEQSTWLVKNQRNSVVHHNRTDWCMNSQRPCHHAEGLYRFKIKWYPVLMRVLDGFSHH